MACLDVCFICLEDPISPWDMWEKRVLQLYYDYQRLSCNIGQFFEGSFFTLTTVEFDNDPLQTDFLFAYYRIKLKIVKSIFLYI